MDFDELYLKYDKLIKFMVHRAISKFPILKDDLKDLINDCWIYIYSDLVRLYKPSHGKFSTLIFNNVNYFLQHEAMKRYKKLDTVNDNLKSQNNNNLIKKAEVKQLLKQALGNEDAKIMELYLGIDNPPLLQKEIATYIGTFISKKTHKSSKGFSAMVISQRIKKSKNKLRSILS